MSKKMLEVLGNIITAVSILFLVWIGISYIEVISKNLNPNPEYSVINFFEIFFGTV